MAPRINISLLLCSLLLIGSCLKNTDSTGNGPRSQIAVTNYIVNGASFDVFYDDTKITTSPLSFGDSSITGSGIYLPLGAGIHNLTVSAGTNIIADNSISFEKGLFYSLFLYDTLKTNRAKMLLLADAFVAVDTIAKARFLQFIPGADTLVLFLRKDTTGFLVPDSYVGRKADPGNTISFLIPMPPGNYNIELQTKGGIILFQQAAFTVLPGKLYSFIARGVRNGTGIFKERVTVIRHN